MQIYALLMTPTGVTHRHVGLAPCLDGLGHRVDEVARYAEIAHFDLAASIDEDVRGLHVAVDHL